MRLARLSLTLLFAILLASWSAHGQATLTINDISPTSGPVGMPVVITGLNFGTTQGTSTVSLNGTNASVAAWTDTAITAIVPSGATSGSFSLTVNNETATSASFTITSLPSGWSDSDVGSVGVAGTASYASGTFTVEGSGTNIGGTADAMHFAYQSLSGDGAIVAHLASSSAGQTGVMIRETLNANATAAFVDFQSSYLYFYQRATTGASMSQVSGGSSYAGSLPYWVELVRSGNSFTAYTSLNGLSWTQLGSSVTISMATDVYIGLAVSSRNNSSLATNTFDTLSVGSASTPAPAISSLSATTGSTGAQIIISGSGFGSDQGGSLVFIGTSPLNVSFWSDSSIIVTLPAGVSSGYLVVSVAPSLNDSNPVSFDVTSQPLPSSWSDGDVGSVGVAGNATYASGTFTVKGSGTNVGGTADSMHFAYQWLSGDGTILAHLASSSAGQTGVMIRETLNPNATAAFVDFRSSYLYFYQRATTGASMAQVSGGSAYAGSLPYWVQLVRSGNSFTVYTSLNGLFWTQLGSTVTISMASNVYIGLAVSSQNNSSLATDTFDTVSVNSTTALAPVISSLSVSTGPIGTQVAISGTGFGNTQGNSVATLGGVSLSISSWTNTAIGATIPSGAASGLIVVSVAPTMNDSNAVAFNVTTQPLPYTWLDQDVGNVGVTGSATYSSGTFTVKGSGTAIGGTADAMHFVYQSLSGNGSIVARVVSTTAGQAGIMIRETLNANATHAFVDYQNSYIYFYERPSTGASDVNQGSLYQGLPYWVQLVRSGSTFTAYTSLNGLYWTQLGSQTITMASNVDVGLAVSSQNNSSLATATFDNVSVSSTAGAAPVITSLSATTGTVGSQITISGSGFGSPQGNSLVTLNGAALTVDTWSATAIVFTVPSGATSGYLVVSVAPSMDDSNPVAFAITSQPLPTPWADQDVGAVNVAGSATYSSGTFTVKASGTAIGSSSDSMHFVYQPLSGDGAIVARIVSASTQVTQAAVMIRETLNPNATNTSAFYKSYVYFYERASTGGNTVNEGNTGTLTLPYWVKLVRSSGTFSAYASSDGSTWTQVGTTQTLSMATNAYIGLAVSSDNNTSLATATFDNVTVTVGTTPFVTGVSPLLGGIGSSVTITGSNFGSSQGTSTLAFNGAAASSISSWTNTQIVAVVPVGASTGPVAATVNSIQSPSSPTFTVINPVITSITPPAAPPSSVVTIAGSDFGGDTGFGIQFIGGQVFFNGVAGQVISWSPTGISVQVPTGATTGPVTIVENGVTSSGFAFTVLEALTVTGLSPTTGSVGSTVTITGTGFGPNQSSSVATVDSMPATVTNWSDTSITAVVPSGASTGPVTVEVAGTTADGPVFVVTAGVQLTDSLGNQTAYTAEIAGGKWYVGFSQGSGCSSCTLRGTIQNAFDGSGNVTSTTDPRGNATSYTYDSSGDVTSITQSAVGGTNPQTTYTYNSFGEVLTMTDPLGHVTSNTYDAHGNLLTITTPPPNSSTAPSVTQFAYNSLGELTQITDPLGHITKITYTSAGYISTITDPQNNVTTYGYDSRGNRTSVTDALNNQTTFTYDSGNRLTQIGYPDSTTMSFAYDYRGRRTSVTDQNGKTTTYAYDDADRLTSVTDAASNVTQYAYDTENNLLSITDANGHETSFAYDAYGRVTQTTFPSSQAETYSYDADNNLTSKTDRKGQTIQYVYDALNRLSQKTYPDSSDVEYTYDLVGKISQVNDPTGTYGFAYDNIGRLIGTTTTYSFLPATQFSNSYSYDADSDRVGYTAPDGSTNTYTYDSLNRITGLANSWAGSFGFSYDVLSRRTQMTRPNGVTTNYTYDKLSHLLSVLHQLSGSTIDGAVYTLDSAGNRTSKTDEYAGVTSNYTYDSIYELTQVTQGTNTMESYTYDPVGNRLSSLGLSPYSYNTSNQLTSTPNSSYSYDYNGSLTSHTLSSNTTTYAWDYEDGLASVTLPNSGGTVTFKYDPFGRRIFRQSPNTTSIFAYDGDRLVETTNSSGGEVARYVQGLNIDEPLSLERGSIIDYYEADGLGSITSLTSTNGLITQTYTFDSFGNTTNSTGSLTNFSRYTGREFDAETNLYYYRARYYDPAVGRFLAEDPMRFWGGDVDLYRYVWNEPASYRDPFGWWGGGVILTAGGGWGLSPAMGAGSISVQTGFFRGGSDGLNHGTVTSYGGFIPDPHSNGVLSAVNDDSSCTCSSSSPKSPSNPPKSWGAGGWIAAGMGGYITNANNAGELSGPFNNFDLNSPLGSFSLEWGRSSNGRFIFQLTIPVGPTLGAGVARYKTLTCLRNDYGD